MPAQLYDGCSIAQALQSSGDCAGKKRIVGMRDDVPYVLCFGGLSDKRIQRDAVQCILE